MESLCSLFYFRPETPFLGKFGSKIQICLFKVKFRTKLIQMMMIFRFSVLERKYRFWKNWFQIVKAVTSVCFTYLTMLCLIFGLTN